MRRKKPAVAVARLLAQMAVVTVLLSAFALGARDFHTYWNLLWLAGIPFLVAWAFDRGFDRGGRIWLLKGFYLLVWGALSMAFIATNILGMGS